MTATRSGSKSSRDGDPDSADGPDTAGSNTDAAGSPTAQANRVARRKTNRWYGLAGVALAIGGVGVLTTQPALLLASAVCAGVVGLVALSPTPPAQLTLSREFDASPRPGEEVTITVEAHNAGDRLLPDVRLVDAVPPRLAVVDGSPRRGVALAAGETATVSYTVRAQRGRHEFGDTVAIVRGLAGATEDEYRIATTDALTVEPAFEPLDQMPLRSLTTDYVGRLPTETGGDGIEFHTTREYRPGDPISRIDWNRRARSGELATLEFRTERAASIVLVADVREPSFVAPGAVPPSAAEVGVAAISRVFPTLLDMGHTVGVATIGESVQWIPPDTGPGHRARVRAALGSDAAFSSDQPSGTIPSVLSVRDLRQRLSENDQIIVCSPLCDDGVVRIVRLLNAYGNQATVISPDPTGAETRGQRIAKMERRRRLAELRRAGVRVIDWSPDMSLDAVLGRAARRWSA